ncbi:hypothetical protein FRC10_001888 [Ceratobasidium sp. 414]|nr:hypothetical protein FRC10_001888 [Ceratobasidium sp. 414]
MASDTLMARRSTNYATQFSSNRRNIEYPWYTSWIRLLTTGLDCVDPNFFTAGRHALTSWGRTREQTPCLEFNPQLRKTEWDEETDDGFADDEPPPLKNNKFPQEFSYKGKRPAQSTSYIETRTRAKEGSPNDPFVALPQPEIKTPERKTSNATVEFMFPSSTETQTFRKNRDSFFLLDFAILNILEPRAPIRNIFDTEVPCHDAYIPIAVEIKPNPTRQLPPSSPKLKFEERLSKKLLFGYEDLNKKLPAAFLCHTLQKSIVGISAVGYWWSFTAVSRGDKHATWSRAFLHGLPKHDDILRDLFQAALQEPSDPIRYQDGLIQRHLNMWMRTTYTKEDAPATDETP